MLKLLVQHSTKNLIQIKTILKFKKIKKFIFGLSQLNKNLYKKKKKLNSSDIKFIIDDAIDRGINCFDTATNYGNTQDIIGKLDSLKKRKLSFFSKAGFVNGKKKRIFSQNHLKKILDDSLRKMKIETIDVFFLNKPTPEDVERNNLIDFIFKEKKKGNILKGGIIVGESFFNDKLYLNPNFEYYSILFNLINTNSEGIFKKLKATKKKIITRSPLNSGVLSKEFFLKGKFENHDYRKKEIYGLDLNNKKKIVNTILRKNKLNKNNLTEISLSFLLFNKDIDHIIYGPSKLHHSKQALNSTKNYKKFMNYKKYKKIIRDNYLLDKKFFTKKQFN